MSPVKRALLSVSDKAGLEVFAKGLVDLGIEIISSGGTAAFLKEHGIPVIDVSSVTGFPEMMGGRIKTLHPKIHGGILARRNEPGDLKQATENGVVLIDLIVVNLYPFEQMVSKPGVSLPEAIEQIDIGGPTLVRSAAKNHAFVGIVTSPAQYESVLKELRESNAALSEKTRQLLSLAAFEYTAHYDAFISAYLRKAFGKESEYPDVLTVSFPKIQDMRYGENPHQTASFYRDTSFTGPCVSTSKQLQGKALSYNNILDANSALELVKEFQETTVVIVKHNNPCGVASNPDVIAAYKTAKSADPEAAFGGVVSVNREVGENLANEIIQLFTEVVIAPSFSPGALETFKKKPNVRLLETGPLQPPLPSREYRSVVGGLLVQDRDSKLTQGDFKVVSKRAPTQLELDSMNYAWKVCKHVKSNSIIYARENRVVGIGAGQMKRVDAAKLGAMIAHEPLNGTALASDAFFPFRDGIDAAAKAGCTAIIQPGGSIRDAEVIAAADEHGMAMVFTGMRHFRH